MFKSVRPTVFFLIACCLLTINLLVVVGIFDKAVAQQCVVAHTAETMAQELCIQKTTTSRTDPNGVQYWSRYWTEHEVGGSGARCHQSRPNVIAHGYDDETGDDEIECVSLEIVPCSQM